MRKPAKMQKRRTMLFLSASELRARLWQNDTISEEYAFSDNAADQRRFAEFIQENSNPIMLLTDLIEEDFRNETVPHLRGGQQRAQQQRKFEQFYRNTPFRQAVLHGRKDEGRRDDEVLFSALTNPHLIFPWLEIIQQQQVPLIGIYSVPTISSPLLKNIPADHILLLSWEKTAGLRQTYFNNNRLYLSRLSPLNIGDSFSNLAASETMRTLQYLKNLSMLPPGEILHVCIICHSDDQHILEQEQHDAGDVTYHYLDIQELGHQFSIGADFPDSDATPFLLGLLAAKPPATHYAPAEYTHVYFLQQTRRWLLLCSAAVAAFTIVWGVVNLWESHTLRSQGQVSNQEAQLLEQRTKEIISEFPHQLASPADMKSAVTTVRTLNEYSPTPDTVWSRLSLILNNFPRIQLDQLSWETMGKADGKGSQAQEPEMEIKGELEDWDGDYRSALDYLDQFQDALKQQGYTVTPMSMPLDVSSKGSITESNVQQQKTAAFSLKITWSLPQ